MADRKSEGKRFFALEIFSNIYHYSLITLVTTILEWIYENFHKHNNECQRFFKFHYGNMIHWLCFFLTNKMKLFIDCIIIYYIIINCNCVICIYRFILDFGFFALSPTLFNLKAISSVLITFFIRYFVYVHISFVLCVCF